MTPIAVRSFGSRRLGVMLLSMALIGSLFVPAAVLAVAPVAPSAPDLAAASDTGSSNADNITKTLNGLVFSGTAEASSTVTILLGGATVLGTATASAGGAYSVTTTTALPDNTANTITATATNVDGTSLPSGPLSVTTDNTAPGAPGVPDLTAGSDTGTSTTDNITSDTTPTFTGTSENNATVDLLADGSVVSSAVASGTTWTITSSALGSGVHSFTARQLDAAGNGLSVESVGLSVTIDTNVPAPPSAPDLAAGSDTGPSSTDNITSDTTPTFTGTAGVSTAVDLYDGATIVGTTTSDGSGNWTITTSALTAATHSITARATNTAGSSAASAALSVTIYTSLTVTVNQLSSQVDPTATAPIYFTVVFSNPVGDFIAGDLTIGGTAPGTKVATVFTGAGTTYTVGITGMTTTGTVTLAVAAGMATDAAGNANTISTSTDNQVTWTPGAPSVTINQATTQNDPTATTPINFTIVFSTAVTGLLGTEVVITGTAGGTKTVALSGSGTTYTAAVSGMTTAGTVIASVPAGVATAGSVVNLASTSTDNSVTWSPGSPTVTINQATGQTDPDSVAPINFTVVFSVAVTGFTGSDVVITGTAGGTKTVAVTGSGTTYTAAVSGMTTAGTVVASVPAGGAINASSLVNLASTSTDNTVTWSAVATAITLTTSAPTPPGAKDPVILWGQGITLTVQFGGTTGGNKSVQLQGTRDHVNWTNITTLTTNSSGRATLLYTPVTNLWYRAVFAGTSDLAAGNSNEVRTVVRQLALLRPTNFGSIKSISRNTSITFTTTVRPARPELDVAKVSFYFYKQVSGSWQLVTRRDVFIDSAGLARTTFRFTSTGQWYVRSAANPTTYNANSVMSPVERYRVR